MWCAAMGQSDPSVKFLRKLGHSLDRELDSWQPPTPSSSDVAESLTEMRSDMIDWLIKLNAKFGFSFETLFTSISVFDRFLHRVRAQRKYLRCIAVTCLYLAAKVCEEDEMVPLTWEVVRRSECGYSEAELLRMERCILSKLDWNLRLTPTSYDFIHLFHAVVLTKCPEHLSPPDSRQSSTALSQLMLACTRVDGLVSYSPSTVALAGLSLYLKLTWDHWLPATKALLSLPQLNECELLACRDIISRSLGAQVIDILAASRRQLCSRAQRTAAVVLEVPAAGKDRSSEGDRLPSLPVTPHIPPAKRRKVEEQDEEVYIDIRRLYGVPDEPVTSQEVTAPLAETSWSSQISCSAEAQWFEAGRLLAPVSAM